MLKRLLASTAIVSLLLCGTFLVYWWRAHAGHSDHLTLGTTGSTQYAFTTVKNSDGRAVILLESRRNLTTGISSQARIYPFKEFIGWFLIAPCLWLAVWVRKLLPKPPGVRRGRAMNDE